MLEDLNNEYNIWIMNIFPKITCQLKYNHDSQLLKERLNGMLSLKKYEGYWEEKYLIISKITQARKMITSENKIEIIDNQTERIVNVESRIENRFEVIIIILFISLLILEFFIIRSYILKVNAFNFFFLVPIILGVIVYFVNYISFWWDADSFKYDLKKFLK